MISILILTKDEQQDLPDCLRSIKWCDDIHVFDSHSTDNTAMIALEFNSKLHQRAFDGYASQRNAAIHEVKFKYDWVLVLDADERVPAELYTEMQNAVQIADPNTSAFRIRRRDFLGNKWLKYSQISPFYIRLIKPEKCKYVREVNEVVEVTGKIEDLMGYFNHFPFSKGFRHWLNKHNSYSTMEAQRWLEEQSGDFDFSWIKALFSRDFNERRYHQKGLFYKLPARPLIKWFYMVFLRRGFLDGSAGLTYATLQSIYEYFIVLKTRELLASKRN